MYQYASPLRYPGGKSCLTKHFVELIKLNNLSNKTYVEPFAGGAGAALSLLFLEFINSIWINDADYNIYCLWYSILNDTEEFIKKISKCKVNINTWKKAKILINNNQNHSKLEIGFSTFFLNRCNHSGIINAGPIGGIEQEGKWKIDARFNKSDLINRITKIANYKERINTSNLDASILLNKINSDNYFFYLDPPYYKKGKELYLNYYEPEDHAMLSNDINKLNTSWVLSYDNTPEITKLYMDKRHKTFDISYSANKTKRGSEILFYSNQLIIPENIY
jgi:DNA adenine methylase